MKYILVIGDGMADHPLDTLGGRTPLEASKKDAIDALARHGILGSVRNVPEGFAPGSDTAIMSIFGCSPRKYFFGRAPLEAAASGIRLAPGDACYRCNMVTYADEDVPFEHKHIISHSAGSIEGRESDELVTMLFDHPDFRPLAEQAGMVIHKGSSFRHLAVQSHVDIKGIQLAPPHDHLGEEIGPILPTGCPNADVLRELMRRAFDILDQHPMQRGVIVRHLALPGHVEDSRAVLQRLAALRAETGVEFIPSLMSQFTPFYKAAEHGLGRRITTYEYRQVIDEAVRLGLTDGYMQEKSSAREEYTPPFDLEGV